MPLRIPAACPPRTAGRRPLPRPLPPVVRPPPAPGTALPGARLAARTRPLPPYPRPLRPRTAGLRIPPPRGSLPPSAPSPHAPARRHWRPALPPVPLPRAAPATAPFGAEDAGIGRRLLFPSGYTEPRRMRRAPRRRRRRPQPAKMPPRCAPESYLCPSMPVPPLPACRPPPAPAVPGIHAGAAPQTACRAADPGPPGRTRRPLA